MFPREYVNALKDIKRNKGYSNLLGITIQWYRNLLILLSLKVRT
jgi:hypothetical protein